MQHELKKFITIAQAKNYSKAARRLHISQPSLSVAISNLEKQLKVSLFVEGKRPLELTPQGAIVFETALRLQTELKIMEDTLKRTELPGTSLRLGAIDSVALGLVSSYLIDKVLSIRVDNSTRLIQGVKDGELDAAVITAPTSPLGDSLHVMAFAEERFSLVCAPNSNHTALQQIKNGAIKEFITYNPESTTYRHIISYAHSVGISLTPIFVSTSPELMRNMVLQTDGIALLPTSMVRQDIATGMLVNIQSRLSAFRRPLSGIYRTRSPRKVMTRSILDALQLDFNDR